MNNTIEATFSIENWDEQPFDESESTAKLTKASVSKTYEGSVSATSATEWLMAYAADGTATFVGIERIAGTIDGRDGSLVLQHVGTFEDGSANATLTVLSGTGDLDGAGGTGTMVADPAGRITLYLRD